MTTWIINSLKSLFFHTHASPEPAWHKPFLPIPPNARPGDMLARYGLHRPVHRIPPPWLDGIKQPSTPIVRINTPRPAGIDMLVTTPLDERQFQIDLDKTQPKLPSIRKKQPKKKALDDFAENDFLL